MQDFLRMYSNLVEKCFMTCCNDFTSKALSSKEVFHFPFFLAVTNVKVLKGNMHHELYREVYQALGTGRSSFRRTKCRQVANILLLSTR